MKKILTMLSLIYFCHPLFAQTLETEEMQLDCQSNPEISAKYLVRDYRISDDRTVWLYGKKISEKKVVSKEEQIVYKQTTDKNGLTIEYSKTEPTVYKIVKEVSEYQEYTCANGEIYSLED